ncbi:DUF6415 family natural product biosynthesis protein [Streptomyces sp. ET3-23]|uniref:DUF6415 family natural product biosynthesis protein n=1 Tax=Streptomyces sp. ET3-23 TaxID=2885643 RepID=UPI001D120E24|nr:DUF6415 family natural product biosynthesis protein [Streptomyces sp. ET3-23]MCC2275447.1 DUF6415 family natural product biosynthesis protein [Streptomyces sp. ET3-23]
MERAELVGDRAFIERFVAKLKESLAIDLLALAHVEDDIDAALGEHAPTANEITPLSLRLRSAVAQLVDLVMQETNGRPQGAVAAAVLRSCRALEEALPTEGDEALGHLRRVALATQDILDQDVISEDVLDRAARLGGEAR